MPSPTDRAAADSHTAWRVHRYGTPAEALALDTVPSRAPGPGEVQVEVAAVGLNYPDLLLCSGRYQERPDPPFVPGYEAAGTVRAVGAQTTLAPGTPVLVVPELPEGALQARLTVPEAQVYAVPATMPMATAAVLHIAYQTAHVALHHRAGLRAGEWVLIDGAAGGVGSAGIQLARAAGAHVVATATGAAKVEACRALGADLALDAGDPELDLAAAVRAATDGRGADVVLDVVGGEQFDRARRAIAFEGRIVVLGFTGGAIPEVRANHVLLRNYSVVGLHLATYRTANPALLRAVHAELVDRWTAGAIAPHVHREVPFAQAPQALGLIADRSAIGRVVLTV